MTKAIDANVVAAKPIKVVCDSMRGGASSKRNTDAFREPLNVRLLWQRNVAFSFWAGHSQKKIN